MKSTLKNRGFSLIELLIVVVCIGIVASIAVPNLLASRRSANEASALQAVKKIGSAQLTYYSTAGSSNYATAAQLFASKLIGARTASAANVNVGGTPPKNTARDGFLFRVQTTAGSPTLGVAATFVVSANPSTTTGLTQTGSRRFCLTDDGVLRSSAQNIATKYNYAQCGFAPAFVP